MTPRHTPYLSNAALGLVVLAVSTSIALVFTPFLLAHLGQERYGVWVLAFSVVQLTLLLDLGFLGAIRRHQAIAFASDSLDEASLVLGASLRFYLPAGLVAFAVFAIIALNGPNVTALPDQLLVEIRWLVLALAVHLLLVFWRAPFAGVIFGSGHVGLDRALAVLPRIIVFVVGTTLITWWRADLASMSVAVLAGAVGSFVVTIAIVRVRWPALRGRRLFGSNRLFRPLVGFGSGLLLLSAGGAMLQWLPQVIIGREIGIEAVAFFAIPSLMVGMIYQMMQAVGAPVFPVASRVDALGTGDQLTDLYRTSTRIQLAVALVASVPVAVLAEVIIDLWIGDEFAWTGVIAAILLGGQLFRFGAIPGRHVLTATREIRALGSAELGYAVFTLTLVTLASVFGDASAQDGLIGVAVVLSLLAFLYSGFVVHAFACHQLKMNYLSLIARLYLKFIPLVVGLTAAGYWARSRVPLESIPALGAALISGVAATAVASFLLYLDGRERRLIADRAVRFATALRAPRMRA